MLREAAEWVLLGAALSLAVGLCFGSKIGLRLR